MWSLWFPVSICDVNMNPWMLESEPIVILVFLTEHLSKRPHTNHTPHSVHRGPLPDGYYLLERPLLLSHQKHLEGPGLLKHQLI